MTPFAEWASCGNHDVLSHVLHVMEDKSHAVLSENDPCNSDKDITINTLVNARNWVDGSSAIYMAISGGHQLALSVLLRQGHADVHVRDFNWNTPLIFCCKVFVERILATPAAAVEISATYHECVMLLLSAGADVNARNINGEHCLHILCRMEPIATSAQLVAKPTFSVLLNAGVDVTLTSYSGYQCIHYAAEKGNWRLLELLFEPVNSQLVGNRGGEDFACSTRSGRGGHGERMIDPNAKGPDGNTALEYADIYLKRTSDDEKEDFSLTIELLLAHGAFRRVSKKVPVEHNQDDLVFMSSVNGSYMVKAASLRRIVERLTAYPRVSTPGTESDRLSFLLQYDAFCKAYEIIALLLGRLADAIVSNPTVSPKEAVATALEGATEVVHFFIQWFTVRTDLIKTLWDNANEEHSSAFFSDFRSFVTVLREAMERYSFGSSPFCTLDSAHAHTLIDSLGKATMHSRDDMKRIIRIIQELFCVGQEYNSSGENGHVMRYDRSLGEVYASLPDDIEMTATDESWQLRQSYALMPVRDPSPTAAAPRPTSHASAFVTYANLHALVQQSITPVLVASDASVVQFLRSSSSHQDSTPFAPKSIWGLTPVQMAQQLTLVLHCLLCFIPVKELLSRNFKDSALTPHFHLLKETSRRISFAFASEILLHSGEAERAQTILFLIHTAECCYRARNLEATVIIVTCLEMTAIYRLKKTWAVVEEIAPGRWASLKAFVGTGGRNFDSKQQNMQSPCVPVIGTLLRHIINITEEPVITKANHRGLPRIPSSRQVLNSSKEHSHSAETLINFHRIRKLGKVRNFIVTPGVVLYCIVPYGNWKCSSICRF